MSASIIVDEGRWAAVQARGLGEGQHESIERGMCAMEAASYIAREPWSDHPKCVDTAIAAFMRSWNDALPNAERGLILPLIPLTVGTAGSKALSERRAMVAVDWFIRVHTPAWLRLAGLTTQADGLAALPELVATAQMPSLRAPLEAVRNDASAAESAARSAAESAARSAAMSAAESAAMSAAMSAARSAAMSAAMSAAWSAAWSAARSAAWSAAWSAAEPALADTKVALQQSAVELVVRMCAISEVDLAAAAAA